MMPVVWDQATYSQAYGYPDPDNRGVRLTYGKKWAQCVEGPSDRSTFNYHLRLWTNESGRIPGIGVNRDILIVGCGFGYTIRVALDAGYNSVWGTDISAFIQGNKAAEAPDATVASRILSIDVSDPAAPSQFHAAGAGNNQGKFNYILTEFVVESFDPATELTEFNAFLDGLDNLRAGGAGGVAHLFAGLLDPPFDQGHDHSLGLTWMKLADWVAVRPVHYWIDVHTWEIGGGQ